MLLFLVVSPFVSVARGTGWIEDYLFDVVLLVAIYNIAGSRRRRLIAGVLGAPAIALRLVLAHRSELPITFPVLLAVLTAGFLGYVIWLVLSDVLRGGRRIGEKVRGAIVAYLLIGVLWSVLYALVNLLEPGSFSVPEAMEAWVRARPEETPLSIFLYYSFVTLATLGYGDVTPIGNAARTLTWAEAVLGQLFIAVAIARLVGIQVAQAGDASKPPED